MTEPGACCLDCYAYDPDHCWCFIKDAYRAPGEVCMGFDYPAPEEEDT